MKGGKLTADLYVFLPQYLNPKEEPVFAKMFRRTKMLRWGFDSLCKRPRP